MKFKKILFFAILFLSTTILFACAKKDEFNPSFKDKGQKIYLYGELHSDEMYFEEELKLIEKHYNDGIRDFFIENSIAGAEYLNMWMKEKDNKILDELVKEANGTYDGTELSKNFYIKIKEKFPELVFHGTDISHQYYSTGRGFLEFLKKNSGSEKLIKLVEENNEQGRLCYSKQNEDMNQFWKMREENMVENFKKAYERLGNKSVVGIYGDAHLGLDSSKHHRKRTDNFTMGDELKKLYGDSLVLTSLVNKVEEKRNQKIQTTE